MSASKSFEKYGKVFCEKCGTIIKYKDAIPSTEKSFRWFCVECHRKEQHAQRQ